MCGENVEIYRGFIYLATRTIFVDLNCILATVHFPAVVQHGVLFT